MIDTLESRVLLTTTTFSGPTNFPGISSPTAIAAANFTGGSTQDVVVEGQAPSTPGVPVLGVYLQSSGSFGKPTLYAFSGTPTGVTTGDFLNNGHQDIAAIDSSSNELIDFLNDGQGNFTPGPGANLGGTSGDTALVSADFNGDGKDDIAAVDPTDNQVVIYFSNFGGEFAAEGNISVPSPIDVVAGDFNGDGHPDLAILSSNGSVYIALNKGNGFFNAPVAYSLGSAGAVPKSLAVADFNGDSQPDLAVIGSASAGGAASAIVLLNNGDGSGTFGLANSVGSVPANPVSVLTGNFTGSGHTDVGVIDGAGGLTVIPGNGDGTFGATQTIYTNQLSPGAAAVAADFNGDGLTDIGYLDSAKGGFSELLNTTGTSVTPPVLTTSPLVPALLSPVPVATLAAGQAVKPIHEVVKLTNSGKTTISGSTTLKLTLSSTTSGASTDPVVDSYSKNVVLKPGKSKTFSLQIKSIPAGLNGSYYVRATVTDPSSNSNSVASGAGIHVVPATIDLTGAFVSTPASVKAGRSAPVTFTVTNLGTVSVVGPLSINVNASDIAGVDSGTVTIEALTEKHVNIKPGGVLHIHLSKTVPSNAPSPFYVVVDVDPNNAYGDVDTANNQFSSSHSITITA